MKEDVSQLKIKLLNLFINYFKKLLKGQSISFEPEMLWIALPPFDFEPKSTNWGCIFRFMGLCKILLRV
jgi:hypothetical protein